jgi:hypothetical protein
VVGDRTIRICEGDWDCLYFQRGLFKQGLLSARREMSPTNNHQFLKSKLGASVSGPIVPPRRGLPTRSRSSLRDVGKRDGLPEIRQGCARADGRRSTLWLTCGVMLCARRQRSSRKRWAIGASRRCSLRVGIPSESDSLEYCAHGYMGNRNIRGRRRHGLGP